MSSQDGWALQALITLVAVAGGYWAAMAGAKYTAREQWRVFNRQWTLALTSGELERLGSRIDGYIGAGDQPLSGTGPEDLARFRHAAKELLISPPEILKHLSVLRKLQPEWFEDQAVVDRESAIREIGASDHKSTKVAADELKQLLKEKLAEA